MFIEPENVFGWLGLKDNGDHYVAAVGLYDYFWALDEETRKKILNGWMEALEAYHNPDFFETGTKIDDCIIVSQSEESVEDKPSANIIPFPIR